MIFLSYWCSTAAVGAAGFGACCRLTCCGRAAFGGGGGLAGREAKPNSSKRFALKLKYIESLSIFT